MYGFYLPRILRYNIWRSPALPSPMQRSSYFRYIVCVMPCHSHHVIYSWLVQELRAKIERIQYFTPPSVVLKRRDRIDLQTAGATFVPLKPTQPATRDIRPPSISLCDSLPARPPARQATGRQVCLSRSFFMKHLHFFRGPVGHLPYCLGPMTRKEGTNFLKR